MPMTRLRRYVTSACDGPFGSAIKSDHYVTEGARVIRLGNIGTAHWRDSDAAFLDLDYWRGLANHHADPGDLVVAGLGDERNPVGRACVVPDLGPALVKADCYRLRLSERADPRFLAYFLSSSAGLQEAAAMSEGSTRPRLTLGKALALHAPDLPRSSQRAIADFLDAETARIDALIERRTRVVDLLGARAQTTRGNWWDGEAREVGVVRLRQLGATVEQGWSPACESAQAEPGEWGVLKTSAVTSGAFNPEENKRLPASISPIPRWLVRSGDLLLVRGSGSAHSVGAVAVVRSNDRLLTISDLIYRVRDLAGLPEFFLEALKAPQVRQQIESTIRTDAGQTLKIRSDDVRDLIVPAVSPANMGAALAPLLVSLSRIRDAQARITRQLGFLREHRQALITAAVTGELKVA